MSGDDQNIKKNYIILGFVFCWFAQHHNLIMYFFFVLNLPFSHFIIYIFGNQQFPGHIQNIIDRLYCMFDSEKSNRSGGKTYCCPQSKVLERMEFIE